MATTTLIDLYCDFWRHTSPFLTHVSVGRLAATGCPKLFNKVTSGLSSFAYRPTIQRSHVIPSIIYSLPNLLALDIVIPYAKRGIKWRTINEMDITMLPKSLKSLTFNVPTWCADWVYKTLLPSFSVAFDSVFPNLTSLSIYASHEPSILTDRMLPLLSMPLTLLAMPYSFQLLDNHLSLLNSTLLYLDVTLSQNWLPSIAIIFPPNLVTLHVYNLPSCFQLASLPRTITNLNVRISFLVKDGYQYEMTETQLRDWPPNLTKLGMCFADGVLAQDLCFSIPIAAALPKTLLYLKSNIQYFESAKVLYHLPPNLIECVPTIPKQANVSEAIPYLPKSLQSIDSCYFAECERWKSLPRTVTRMQSGAIGAWYFDSKSSLFAHDLPPLLTSIETYSSFFQPWCPVFKNIQKLIIKIKSRRLETDWPPFFEIISTKLPNLQSLDLGWGNLIDASLLNVLQQPLKKLRLSCDPRTLDFSSKTWCSSLEVLEVRTSHYGRPLELDVDVYQHEDSNWRLPSTLTSLIIDHSLIFLSPSQFNSWPPNLGKIEMRNLTMEKSSILWTSLPSGLRNLHVAVTNGATDVLGSRAFIDSLGHLPITIESFTFDHSFYYRMGGSRQYYNSREQFCVPKSCLDLVQRHPRLALLSICSAEVNMLDLDSNPHL